MPEDSFTVRSKPEWSRVGVAAACIIAPTSSGDGGFLSISLEPQSILGPERGRRLDPLSQLALVAVDGARQRAKDGNAGCIDERSREGVAFGSAFGATTTSVRYARRLIRAGAAATNPIDFPDSIDGAPAAHVALDLGLGGPSLTFADGEQSGVSALVLAARQIALGRATRMVVVVGDKLEAPFGRALADDPAFVRDGSGNDCAAAECVFALVLECQREPAIELVGLLDPVAGPGKAPDDGGSSFSLQLDGERLLLVREPDAKFRQLKDPSGALALAGAWLGILGPTEFYGGAIERATMGPTANRVRCGMPYYPGLGFVRSARL
jgi:hypothetical protein